MQTTEKKPLDDPYSSTVNLIGPTEKDPPDDPYACIDTVGTIVTGIIVCSIPIGLTVLILHYTAPQSLTFNKLKTFA